MQVEKIKKQIQPIDIDNDSTIHNLVLFNDDFNTFDFVIDCLIDICKHHEEQAAQCASITHNNGKCDIKKGNYEYLVTLEKQLIQKGLTVEIV